MLFRSFLTVGAPALFFVLLESGLRIANVGYAAEFLRPENSAAGKFWIENPSFTWRFFSTPEQARESWPIRVAAQKPSNAFRVLVVGGSAVHGTPSPSFGICRMLEVLLQEALPERRVEVINAAIVAVNSHVCREIVSEACAKLKPDALVIYSGNNEVVGPYGPGTVFQPFTGHQLFTRASIFLHSTRTGQLLTKALKAIKPPSHSTWGGMAMFLDRQIPADHPDLLRVVESFRANLKAMISAAGKAGASTYLCTVPVNLGDSPPFKSSPMENPAASAPLLHLGLQALYMGKPELALPQLEQLIREEPDHALAHYILGIASRDAGLTNEAKKLLLKACDLDTLRFRADSRINAAIRKVAAETSSQTPPPSFNLVDLETELARLSPQGIPGAGFFHEHVHLTFNGNLASAKAIATVIGSRLTPNYDFAAFPRETMVERLAFTVDDELVVMRKMLEFLDKPPFPAQWNHAGQIRQTSARITRLATLSAGNDLLALKNQYKTALKFRPHDWVLHHNLARLLESRGDPTDALASAELALALMPHSMPIRTTVARLLASLGEMDRAAAVLLEGAPDREKNEASINESLGDLLVGSHPSIAADCFRKSEEQRKSSRVKFKRAKVLLGLGDVAQAERILNELASQTPHAAVLVDLGILAAEAGRFEEASGYFFQALEKSPGHLDASFNLAQLKEGSGDLSGAAELFRKALLYTPGDLPSRARLARILGQQTKFPEALTVVQEGLQHACDWEEGHRLAAELNIRLGNQQEASFHLFELMRINPANPGYPAQIASLCLESGATGQLPLAAMMADAAVTLSGRKDPIFLELFREVLEKSGQLPEAEGIRKEISALNTNAPAPSKTTSP